MACDNSEKRSKSQVLRKNKKKEPSKHGPLKNERYDQVPKRSEHPLLTGHIRRVLFKKKTGKICKQLGA